MEDGRWELGKHPQILDLRFAIGAHLFLLRFDAARSPFSKAFVELVAFVIQLRATVLISPENLAARAQKVPSPIFHLVGLVSL